MEDLPKLRKLYQLKTVERASPVGKRKESSAEHSWSSLILADYFLSTISAKIDRLKVYELLMYHDVVEIECGDIPIHHVEKRKDKKEKEMIAAHVLKEHIPPPLNEKFIRLFEEFEEHKTKEAKFAKAIDAFDALIHFLDYKSAWKGWSEEMVRKFHGEKISQFPELAEAFEKTIQFCREHGYFNQ